ncbi:MAG: glycoside hydrolase family 9 protein [Limisphaerales bacterium]
MASPITDNQTVQVQNPDGTLWPTNMQFSTVSDPLRYSPAIHVNQEGYVPAFPKKAMVGYYLGNLGELPVPTAAGFTLVDTNTGASVYQGSLTRRQDVGYNSTPTPYQSVYVADFSSFATPGTYRLQVSGMGASLPFQINDGVALDFVRAYALGLYHQRCGTNNVMPFTRFVHDVCHSAPASVPVPAANFPFTWNTVSNYALISNPDNPPQIAPRLTGETAQLYPYVRTGTIDVSGGHHDAGDYSKYTINSTKLIHTLMFAVDAFPGVAALDNLGIPESGDGISDVLQEAKWEADFLAKMQDADGGFYFLVYPQNREYESNVLPDQGDPQVVWPKTTSVTAAGVAALAQCASSPLFKKTFPAAASNYLARAQSGWAFLTNAIAKYSKAGAYQKITHYGDDFTHDDELAWAACEMFLATGDPAYQQQLIAWFDPSSPATWRWGWWHMTESYGNAIRSFAFAAKSGRLQASQLDPTFLSKCQTEIATAGHAALTWSEDSAYGTSFPTETKAVNSAGCYFSSDQAFDITVAYQLNPAPQYLDAILLNMNYEGGCNPVNVTYVTGLGWKRQRETVGQYAQNDRRVLPPSGLPLGNVQGGFANTLYYYATELNELSFPQDGASTAPDPFYDRWGESYNVTTEFVVLNQARSLASLAYAATLTASSTHADQHRSLKHAGDDLSAGAGHSRFKQRPGCLGGPRPGAGLWHEFHLLADSCRSTVGRGGGSMARWPADFCDEYFLGRQLAGRLDRGRFA